MSENNIIEDEVKHYVFVKQGRRHYDPQYLTAGLTTVQWIFPIPTSNAIGTLDKESNGIVSIKFGDYGKDPERQVIAQNFSSRVYGPFDYRFCPNFSDDTIAYCKTRVAIVANIKTSKTFHVGCGLSMNDYMLGIRFLNPQENLFVTLKSVDEGGNGWVDYLHVAKLDGQKFVDTGEPIKIGQTQRISPDFPLYSTWSVHDKTLFVYNNARMLSTDGTQPRPHPFAETFNSNADRLGTVKDFAIHPELPFGVIIEEGAPNAHDLIVLRWDITNPKKKDEQLISFCQYLEPLAQLFELEGMALAYQSFSPDGSWYVVGCISPEKPKSPHFVAVPVSPADKEHPYFLDMDNLVVLGQVAGLTSAAWTFEPVSYVVSDGELLRLWDLDEVADARVFVMPGEDGDGAKGSIFRKVGRLFGVGR